MAMNKNEQAAFDRIITSNRVLESEVMKLKETVEDMTAEILGTNEDLDAYRTKAENLREELERFRGWVNNAKDLDPNGRNWGAQQVVSNEFDSSELYRSMRHDI